MALDRGALLLSVIRRRDDGPTANDLISNQYALAFAQPQKDELRVVITSAIDFVKALRGGELRFGCLFHDNQRVWCQPAAGACRIERFGCQSLSVGWVEEGERERGKRIRLTELGRVAAEDLGRSPKTERRHILPQQRTRLRAFVDEKRECGAA